MKVPWPDRSKRRVVIIMATALHFLFIPILSAQRYTYLNPGIQLHSAIPLGQSSLFPPVSYYPVDGGGYTLTIRQEVNNFLSIRTGVVALGTFKEFIYGESVFDLLGYHAHRLPVKAELEVDLLRDRIIGYASFGLEIALPFRWDLNHGYRTTYTATDTLTSNAFYLLDHRVHTYYTVGFGLRFRLIDQLHLEIESGYGSTFRDIIEVQFWEEKPSFYNTPPYDFAIRDKMNYFYLSFSIAYPFQRMADGVRKLKEVGAHLTGAWTE